MKRIVLLAFVLAIALSASTVFATSLGSFPDPLGSGILLNISRTTPTGNALFPWEWTFQFTNVTNTTLESFSAGFNPAFYNTPTVYYTGFSGTSGTAAVLADGSAVVWTNIALAPGASGTWSYQTSLPSISSASYATRDGGLTAAWNNLPAPGPSAVPEPMSILLGCLGMVSVGAFRRLRSK